MIIKKEEVIELVKALRPLATLLPLVEGDKDEEFFFIHDGSIVTAGDIRKAAELTEKFDAWAPEGRPKEPGVYEVWAESSVSATGFKVEALLIGVVHAASFHEACVGLAKQNGRDGDFDPESLTFMGWRLFDNEIDARKRFG